MNYNPNVNVPDLKMKAWAAALVLAWGALLVRDVSLLATSAKKSAEIMAEVIGQNSAMALSLNHADNAVDVLQSLKTRPSVRAACIYSAEGEVFAAYARDGVPRTFAPRLRGPDRIAFEGDHLVVFQAVVLNGKFLGTVFLESDLNEFCAEVARSVVLFILVLALSAACFYFGLRRQTPIPGSTVHVAQTTEEIQTLKDDADRAHRESADRFRLLFTKSPLPAWLYDLETYQFLEVNEAAVTHYGYSHEEFLKMRIIDIRPPEERARHLAALKTAGFATGYVGEWRHQLKNGRIIDVDVTRHPLELNGRTVALAVLQDVTERKQVAAALQKAKEAAEEANRAKGEFLANMSHEIRTPMNGVLGMTDLLLDTELNPEQLEYAGLVKTSAESLLTILNDILDFSKIEAGRLELESIEFDLRESLAAAFKPLALRARQKGLELTCDIRPEVPEHLIGDPGRLRQIIVNLVGNAVKFTERGEVGLRVSVDSNAQDGLQLHFVVQDTGIGIAAEKQKAIFEAFSQADGSIARRFGGTGLGLTICSRMVGVMGGKIWVESALGQGSAFHFTANLGMGKDVIKTPLLNAPGRQHEPEGGVVRSPIQKGGRLRLLLAEDNVINQRVVKGIREKKGHRVTIAGNGREALAALAKENFDVVLMDVQMPEMDGFEATAAIRARERETGSHLPIIAMTAYAMLGDQERCLKAGMDGYISKPLNFQELKDQLQRFSGADQEDTTPA